MNRGGVRRTLLIARRELRERLAQRAFRIALLVGVVLAAAAVALPPLLGGDDGEGGGEQVPVATEQGRLDAARLGSLADVARALGGPAAPRFSAAPDAAAVRAGVREGDANVGLLIGNDAARVVVREDGGGDLATQVAMAAEREALVRALQNEAPGAAELASKPQPVGAETVQGSGPDEETAAVVSILSLLLYLGGLLLMTSYATGLVGDRAGRVTERLLTAARPVEHLTGKLLGVGAAGALQLLAWIAGALGAAIATEGSGATSPLAELPAGALVFFPVAFLLTYILYSALATLLVLPVRKSEDAASALTPGTILQVVAFFLAASIVSPGSTVPTGVAIASLVPFFSPLVMLARLAGGDVAVWELAIAVLGPLLLAALLLRLAAPAYARHAIDAPEGKGISGALRALRR